MLSKKCENELYVICNIFLNYMKTKCVSEIWREKKCKV